MVYRAGKIDHTIQSGDMVEHIVALLVEAKAEELKAEKEAEKLAAEQEAAGRIPDRWRTGSGWWRQRARQGPHQRGQTVRPA